MGHSEWLKTDLHIHSNCSNNTKDNDYTGILKYNDLLKALNDEEVSLFSITDHNTVNIDFYRELIQKRNELIEKNLNFVIGAEIDFEDRSVHTKVFHMLVYFDTYDLNKIENVFKELYNVDEISKIDKSVTPISISHFFKTVFANGIKNVVTIPHFNNKTKGIPPNEQIDKFIFTVFNALEDSNNSGKIADSIKQFESDGYTDIPIVVFSDNHNIKIYPRGKNETTEKTEKATSIYIMGNIKYPFESIKMAFQDVNTRLCIKNTETRSNIVKHKYIKKIVIGDSEINFSPYQNTIIGGFGTGKSFLLDLIVNGKKDISNKYKNLSDNYEKFDIVLSTDVHIKSLNEKSNEINIVRFDQYKDIYFKNILEDKDKNTFQDTLHINFPSLETLSINKYTELISAFNVLKLNINNKITDTINYETYAQKSNKGYSYKIDRIKDLFIEEEYISDLYKNLEIEKNQKVLNDYCIYDEIEKTHIQETVDIIKNKHKCFEKINKDTIIISDAINLKIDGHNKKVEEMDSKITGTVNIVENIKTDLTELIGNLKQLKKYAVEFDENYSETKFEELANIKNENKLFDNYKLIAQYNLENKSINYKESIIKNNYRNFSFDIAIIKTLKEEDQFHQNNSFEKNINSFVATFNKNFSEICYDILEDDISIMKKSAGEKANAIINIIFEKIVAYSKENKETIVILDQPEDNLDNKGIQNKVVKKIRKMKESNILPQLICVTHNANISITADSENIILASKNDGFCTYENGGIENTEFTEKVCKIVEGSKEALKRRGAKFNIPIIKELEGEMENE